MRMLAASPILRQCGSSRRAGSATLFVLLLLALAAGTGGLIWYYVRPGDNQATASVLTTAAFRGPYAHIVLEQGTVESSSNVEIRCEVKSAGTGGTEIIWVIDEGTLVKKGDKLVELKTSTLERELVQQQISCNTSRAMVVQAENTLEAAKIARTEYLEGTFRQQEQEILSAIFVAEEALRRAELGFQSTERLAARGIVRSLQLEGDQFAVEKARNELESAQTKLHVLRQYTKEKTLKQFDSDITIGEAKYESEQESYRLELEKLEEIREQIANCTIVAPDDGQVVHANTTSGSTEFVVEPGAMVRENQVLIRLPDPSKMQVKATINESRISLVRSGMPAAIQFDALRNQTVQGRVTRVNQYAEPTSWRSGNIKQYAAFIEIYDPPLEVRSGMNAEVRIFVDQQEDSLQVPVQALYETKGQFFCLVKDGDRWETRLIRVGSSNDSFMTIESGLSEGEVLVMNPRAHPQKLNLPDLPDLQKPELPTIASGTTANDTSSGRPGPTFVAAPDVDGRGAGPNGSARPASAGGEGGRPGGDFDPARIFAALDTDGDGVLSAQELQNVPADRRGRILAADADGDGTVTREEFMRAMSALAGGASRGGDAGR